jgi:hypothetical protein
VTVLILDTRALEVVADPKAEWTLGGGLVATGDPDDLRSLAREHPNIKVQPLS